MRIVFQMAFDENTICRMLNYLAQTVPSPTPHNHTL